MRLPIAPRPTTATFATLLVLPGAPPAALPRHGPAAVDLEVSLEGLARNHGHALGVRRASGMRGDERVRAGQQPADAVVAVDVRLGRAVLGPEPRDRCAGDVGAADDGALGGGGGSLNERRAGAGA